MEVYNEVENDAGDAYPYDATAGTAGHEHEEPGYNMQMVRHIEEEENADRDELIELGVFKPTSGNATKRLRTRQETRGTTRTTTTRAGKSAEAVIKQFASQELRGEKEKMEGWKAIVMEEVARELQGIRRAQEEAIEAQRQSFQAELERLEKAWDEKSKLLEDEIKLLKNSKQYPAPKVADPMLGKKLAQSNHANTNRQKPSNVRNPFTIPSSSKVTSGKPSAESTKRIEKQSYAAVAASTPSQIPEQPWTQVKYKNRKPNQQHSVHSTLNAEYQGRRILFPREGTGRQMSEADLMLALNEALARAGEGIDIRFSRVRYSPSGAVSALLTEKANAGLLIPRLSNVLIRAAKTVDAAIIGVDILEHWQRLKIHGMSLDRYLGDGKMELLRREVESSTGIQLKTIPRWLISETRLREQQESGQKRGSAIVITVKGESEAKQLCASGL